MVPMGYSARWLNLLGAGLGGTAVNLLPLAVLPGSFVLAVSWVLLATVALLGLVALTAPRSFARIAAGGARWFDTNKWLAALDRRVDVDGYVLPFSRLLGGLVLAAAAVLAYLLWRYA
jgi:hypothetical protein